MKSLIDNNTKSTDEINQDCDDVDKKLNKHYFDFLDSKAFLNKLLGQNQNSSSYQMYSPKSQGLTAA